MDDNEPSYILWFLIIFTAVTLGNLASNYISAKIAEYQIAQAAAEIARIGAAALQDFQKQSAKQQARSATQQRQQRLNSPIGIKLEQECSDWTLNHAQTKSNYAAMERNKRCGQLQHYIDTGAVPR